MTRQFDLRLLSALKSFSRSASLAAILVGSVVLIAWTLDIATLKSLLPGLPRMTANTALGILLAGASLWLQQKGHAEQRTRRLAQGAACVVAMLGLLTLGEYLFGWDLGIDQLLFKDTTVGATYPGRPSPHTALTFVLIGLALLLLDVEALHGHHPAQFLVLTAALIPLVALVGYVYEVSIFYGITAYTGMAVHTAIAFIVLCLGILFTHSERGLMAVVASGHFGGMMARRLLLAAVGIPIVLGWLRLKGEQVGLYDAFLGASLLALSSVVVFVVLIWATARSLNQADAERQQAEAARLKIVRAVEQTDVGLMIANRQGQIEFTNPAYERISGYSSQELLAQTPRLLRSGVHSTQFYSKLWDTILAGETFRAVFINKAKDGRLIHIDETITPIKDAQGNITHFVSVWKDITEQVQAEHALRESEARFRAIFEEAAIGIALVDMQGHPVQSNRALQQMLGYSGQELRRMVFTEFTHPDDVALDWALAQELFAGKRGHYQIEKRYVRKDGTLVWARLVGSLVRDVSGEPQFAIGMVEDITERVRVEEERERLFAEVQTGRARLAVLTARLIDAQESERRRLARELHDEIGQALTGLRVILEIAAGLPAGSEALGARLKQALGLIERVTAQVRDMSLQLRPSILDDLGLLPALLWHFERYTAQTNVRVAVEHRGLKDRRFAPEIETAAFRIVQEALTNVARHAGVGEATVRLWANQDTLGVQIEDRGRGFDAEVALAAGASSGLSGMRERALSLGGRFEVESSPGAGTRLTAELPLDSGPLERRERER